MILGRAEYVDRRGGAFATRTGIDRDSRQIRQMERLSNVYISGCHDGVLDIKVQTVSVDTGPLVNYGALVQIAGRIQSKGRRASDG
jgi:hypothetical protein